MLTLAASFRLTRRLFGPVAALVSLALVAVTFWPLFFARVAVRGMTLPLAICLGADSWFSCLESPASKRRTWATNRFALIAGLFFGLSAYTYLAARAVPILLLGFAVYLALFARKHMQGRWRDYAAMLALAIVIAAPLIIYLLLHPEIQFRVSEVSAPLTKLAQGDPSEILTGIRKTALMFSVQGDQTIYYNLPGRPVLVEPLSAILFYIGVAVAVWRWRKPVYAFVLIGSVVLLSPAMVTAEPPAFVRALGALPALFAFPGIGAAAITDWAQRRWDTARIRRYGTCLVLAMLGLNSFLTVRDYFFRWPARPDTQFIWQTDLAAVARFLDSATGPPDVAIAGLSNDTMDDPSLRLLLKRRDLSVRWFDSRTTLIIPPTPGRLFIPRIVPLDPLLRARLASWGAQERADPLGHFTWFELPAPDIQARMISVPMTATLVAGGSIPLPVDLDNGTTFMGYEILRSTVRPGETVTVLSYWRVKALPLPPLKAFVHLEDTDGKLFTQSDGLNAPTQFWRVGDTILQMHNLQMPPDGEPGTYHLKLGLYDARTGSRAQFLGMAGQPVGDHILLPDVEVKP
jgi:hypothetical protein